MSPGGSSRCSRAEEKELLLTTGLLMQQHQMPDVKLISKRLQTRRRMKETKKKKANTRKFRQEEMTIFGYQTDDDLLSNYSSEGSNDLK